MTKFGKTSDGKEAALYTLENSNGVIATVTDYGATLVQIIVPDKNGATKDVVLGYDNVSGYEKGGCFFGATVGRSANRIAGASFRLNNSVYKLADNDNGNNLHSGMNFYSKRFWNVENVGDTTITFTLLSEDMDQGYPGKANISVIYELLNDNELKITYIAVSDKDTIFNMTNHSYFNLDGHSSTTLMNQNIYIDADAFTPTNESLIPTGEIKPVEGTPMDFRSTKAVGLDIDKDFEALKLGGGYDHNYCLNGSGYRKVASLNSESTGINMDVYTDLPGMQLYTGNFIMNEVGKDNTHYCRRQALCFETQFYPNAINEENFHSPIFTKDEEYKTVTGYKFKVN
ncbi:MAG: aldose epimerase family protein [Suipraeoptans sp.]